MNALEFFKAVLLPHPKDEDDEKPEALKHASLARRRPRQRTKAARQEQRRKGLYRRPQ
jgi:hypothetical protein